MVSLLLDRSNRNQADKAQHQAAKMADEKRPGLWARLSVNHTKKTCIGSCMLPIVAIGLIVAFKLFTLSDPTGNDYFVRNDLRTELNDARTAALAEYPFETFQDEPLRAQKDDERALITLLRNTKPGGKEGSYIADDLDLKKKGQNVLTPESLAQLKFLEDELVSSQGFNELCWIDNQNEFDCDGNKRSCALPNSITNHPFLYGVFKNKTLCGRKSTAEPVSRENFELFMNDMIVDGNPNVLYSIFLGKDFSASTKGTQIVRSFLLFGKPTTNSTTTEDKEKSLEIYRTWSKKAADNVDARSNGRYHFTALGEAYFNGAFSSIILRDLSFAVISIILVFIVIAFHTTSIFLACTALAQIILAFPLTYVVYRGVLQVKYFAALQIMTIFLILGIGADDVFVFIDAWKQSAVVLGRDSTLVDRMSWAYRRAVKAMSVTSFTTAAAFFVTAVSPIMPISTLGIWAGLLILLQFVLVITIFPCATIIWHRFWRVRKWTNCLQAPKPQDDAVQEDDDQNDEEKKGFSFLCFGKKKKKNECEYRPIEKFFNSTWTKWMNVARIPLCIVAIIIVGVSIYLATRLETPREEEKFLPDSNPIQKALNLLGTAFPVIDSSSKVTVRIMWGVKGINRAGVSRYRPLDIGSAELDSTFSMRTAAAQDRILEACNYFSDPKKDLLTKEATLLRKRSCWIEDFKLWRQKTNKGDNFEDYASEKDLADAVIEFGTWKDPKGRQPFLSNLVGQKIGFNTNRTKIIFTDISFVSDLERGSPYAISKPHYDEWQNLLVKFSKETKVEGVKMPFAVGGIQWLWMITQKALIDNMFLGIGVVFAVSLVSLSLSTGNIIVSIVSLISIAGIFINLLALIYLLGWNLGITESIGVVIAIGFSFDYVAHLANAYVESHASSKLERTRDALTDLGISVLAGAVSTLLAGSMLFNAQIVFFLKFGVFIFATISLSLIWGLVFFPSLLLIFGPVNETGELKPLLRKLISCFRKEEKPEAAEV